MVGDSMCVERFVCRLGGKISIIEQDCLIAVILKSFSAAERKDEREERVTGP